MDNDLKTLLAKFEGGEIWFLDGNTARLVEVLAAKVIELEKRLDTLDDIKWNED